MVNRVLFIRSDPSAVLIVLDMACMTLDINEMNLKPYAMASQ